VKSKLIYLLLVMVTLPAFGKLWQVDGWLLSREKEGIKVFTKKSRWGKLRDSRAEMLLPGTKIDDVVKLIADFDGYPHWLPRCRTAKVLARMSDNEFIGYMVFHSPWPVADRDCVVRVRIDRDSTSGAVTIRETSEPKYINSKSDVVRIEQMYSVWHITPHGDAISVSNEYASNPGGEVPDWLTNTQSVENPYAMFSTLKTAIPSANNAKGKSGQ